MDHPSFKIGCLLLNIAVVLSFVYVIFEGVNSGPAAMALFIIVPVGMAVVGGVGGLSLLWLYFLGRTPAKKLPKSQFVFTKSGEIIEVVDEKSKRRSDE